MTSAEMQQRIAIEFVQNLIAGGVSAQHYADDMTVWTLVSGLSTKDVYLGRLRIVGQVFSPPLEITVDAVDAQLGWVAARAHSAGQLIDGVAYSNNYLFVLEFNERCQIRHVREYCDLDRAQIVVSAMQGLSPRGKSHLA